MVAEYFSGEGWVSPVRGLRLTESRTFPLSSSPSITASSLSLKPSRLQHVATNKYLGYVAGMNWRYLYLQSLRRRRRLNPITLNAPLQ